MSVFHQLSSQLGRKDDLPNKELGTALAAAHDLEGIQEIASHLWDDDVRIQTDCLSVLEHIGHATPQLIEAFVPDFLRLITSRHNRVIWATMIDLAMVAERRSREIYEQRGLIIDRIESGSVITVDNGIKILSKVAATDPEYGQILFPYLLEKLSQCRSKSIPQYAESIRLAVTPQNQDPYLKILKERLSDLTPSQQNRVRKILKGF